MTDKLDKPKTEVPTVTKVHRIKLPGLHSRLYKSQQEITDNPPESMPNRICILPDCSGSMGSVVDFRVMESDRMPDKTKMDYLKEAVESFGENCKWSETSVAVVSFPHNVTELPLTNQQGMFVAGITTLKVSGNTPMGHSMARAIENVPMTRAIIISDGEATDNPMPIETAHQYAEAKIPIDCVHIGREQHGEELLQQIAKITDGKYIKFDDVANFAKALKYLTPAYRALLNAPSAAEILGAKEVK